MPALLVTLAFPLLNVASAPAAEIALPPETARLLKSPLPGYALANALCLTCHSADYVKMQPTFTRAKWKAEVTKMQKTYGAPLPDAAIDPIVEYLVKTYGEERAAAEPTGKPGASMPTTKAFPVSH